MLLANVQAGNELRPCRAGPAALQRFLGICTHVDRAQRFFSCVLQVEVMSSSASLLLPSASLETRCSLDGCLLSPKLSTHNEELGCFSPRLPGLEQLKPTNVSVLHDNFPLSRVGCQVFGAASV